MKVPLVDLKLQYLSIKPEVDREIKRILDQSAFILGSDIEKFEKKFAKFCGAKYAIGVSSGTRALELALRALDIGKGDEVITTAHTFLATAAAIAHAGAKPVFVDIDSETLNIDERKIEKAVTKKAKAIIPVHLYGNPAKMDEITKIARKHGLNVIEDASQAHGAIYKGKKVGIFGQIGCFSLFPAKNLGAYGDAGILVTSSKGLYQRLNLLRNHGRSGKNKHTLIGYTARLDNLQAAILNIKLSKLNAWNRKRREHAKMYKEFLSDAKEVSFPKETEKSRPVYCYFVIKCSERNKLMKFLKKKGIGASIHYPQPVHLQPAFNFLGYEKGSFPEAERAVKEVLSLPMYPELKKGQIKYVTDQIKKFFWQSQK